MCCIFGFIKWSIGCLHRTLTFFLGFWFILMIIYACGFAIAAGVAYGYDYCLAEYATLARSDVSIEMQPRKYTPEVLVRRRGNMAGVQALGDEFQPRSHEVYGEDIEDTFQQSETKPLPTLWIYRPSRKHPKWVTPSYRLMQSATRTEEIQPEERIEITETENTSASSEPSISIRTTRNTESSKPEKNTKVPTRSPPMREFMPNNLKWRPTKPDNKFFYNTPENMQRRKTVGNSYHPEMEIRLFNQPWYGKFEGVPMRHWDIWDTSKATESDASQEDNLNKVYF